MRIVAINGSHRGARGYTGLLVGQLFRGARAAGAECKQIELARMKVSRCIACDRCQEREPLYHCVHEGRDEVASIFDELRRADLIVYATPVYVFGLSSLLKSFLERMYSTGGASKLAVSEAGLFFHEVDHAACSKPFAVLVCCDNIEDETPRNVIEYFRTFSRFMDAPLVGELVRNAGLLAGHGDPGAAETFPRLEGVWSAFEKAGRELAEQGRISRSTMREANREIIPVPAFGLLKTLRWRRLKRAFVEKAEQMRSTAEAGSGGRIGESGGPE